MTPKEIRQSRLKLDLTLEQFGKLFNRGSGAVWRWEQKDPRYNSIPPPDVIDKLREIMSRYNSETPN